MKHLRLPIYLLALALLAGCVNLDKPAADKQYYLISPVRQGEPKPPSGDVILKLRRLTVSDLYSTRELVYQMDGGRMVSDFYNMFFVTPQNNLTSELKNWLAASGLFAHIIEPGSMVVPTLTLEGVVNSLYGDYSAAQPSAVVSMQFFLVDEASPNNDIVFSKGYSQRVPFDSPGPDKLVKAMTLGVQTIFRELEQDLANAPIR